MKIEVVMLPALLRTESLTGRAVVVFDVLRATTSMTAALAAGARQIRVFDSLDAAASAARDWPDAKRLCGEAQCLPPHGFDLGNSPASFSPEVVGGRTLFMSTTNGTRALAAARRAERIYIGALTNASAVTKLLAAGGMDVTLLCAGTDSEVSMEDLIGAGAVAQTLRRQHNAQLRNDAAEIAVQLYLNAAPDLPAALRRTRGGRNIISAGLMRDIDDAAKLNSTRVVGYCDGGELVVRLG